MDEPFDARRLMLMDQGKPPHLWRTVSLVAALRGALADITAVRGADPEAAILGITAELTSRGLDGDSLVRFGLGPEIFTSLIDCVLTRLRQAGWDPSAASEPPDEDPTLLAFLARRFHAVRVP